MRGCGRFLRNVALLICGFLVSLGLGVITQASADTVGTGGAFVAISPSVKIVDTRTALGISATLGSASTNSFQVLGEGGVPSEGVSAVSLTVVATNPTYSLSYMELWPDGTTKPTPGSMLDFTAGQTISNLTLVAVGADGKIDVYNSRGTADLVVTVNGYFTSSAGSGTAAGGYVPVTQSRFIDTRDGTGTPEAQIPPGGSITVPIDGADGISDASSVFANLTVPSPAAAGLLYAYPTGGSKGQPVLDYPAETTADTSTIAVGSTGSITLTNGSTTKSIDVILDVYGYFTPIVTQGGGFTPTQARLLDTRSTGTAIPGHSSITVTVGGTHGIPTYGVGGAVLNLTTVDQTAGGNLIAWPTGQPMPGTSIANYESGDARADLAIVQPGAGGAVSIYNNGSASVDLVVDLQGWFAAVEPSVPVDLVTADTDTTAPALSGVAYGPTGDSVTGEIFVQDASGNAVGDTPTALGTVPSGERVTYVIPEGTVTTGQTYSWYMMACYASLCSAPTATQTFTVGTSDSSSSDPTKPADAISTTLSGTSMPTEDAITDSTECSGAACPTNTSTTTLNVGGDGTSHWVSAIKPDLAAIPAGSTVYSASLKLTKAGCLNGCSGDTLDVDQADGDVTAQTTGAALLAQADSSGPGDSGTESFGTYDVTALVAGWLSGAFPNDGLVLQADDQSSATTGESYYSSSAANLASETPQLTVTYTAPTVPSAPQGVSAEAGDSGVLVQWSPPQDEGDTSAGDNGVTGYTVQALDIGGNVVQQVSSTDLHAIVGGLTNGESYTFAVSATNSIGAGPAVDSTAVSPLPVAGGTSQYVQAAGQFLNAKDQLEESPTATSAGVAANFTSAVSFNDQLSQGAGDDTAVALLQQENSEQDTQDVTTLSDTLVVQAPGSTSAVVYTTADETFTTVDSSGGTTAFIPGESITNPEFFFASGSGTPYITGYVDSEAALDRLVDGVDVTAATPADQNASSDDPEWTVGSSGQLSLAPGMIPPGPPTYQGYPKIASWAYNHYNIAYTFHDDCTNFVSEALHLGAGIPMTMPKHPNMNFTTSNDNYWYKSSSPHGYSHAWSVAEDFYKYEKGDHWPYSTTFVAPHDALAGDIIFVNWYGSSPNSIDHAAVITSIKGKNIYVTQHSPTQRGIPVYKTNSFSWQKEDPSLHAWVVEEF